MYTQASTELSKAMKETIALLDSAPESTINKIPFKGSWTAAQTAQHLIKAGRGMPEIFKNPAPKAKRQPDEKVGEWKEIMLDPDSKMESPEFIVPEDRQYNKEKLINDTESIRKQTLEILKTADMDEIPDMEEGNPLKGSTKLELLYFVIFHTQRHNRQMRKILETLNNS